MKLFVELGFLGDFVMGGEMQYDIDGFLLVVLFELGSMQELVFGEDVKFVELLGVGIDYGLFMCQ